MTWKESDSEYSFDSKKRNKQQQNSNKEQIATTTETTWCFNHHAAASASVDFADEKTMDVGETQMFCQRDENSEDISMKKGEDSVIYRTFPVHPPKKGLF